MEITKLYPPRIFRLGMQAQIEIKHCANIELATDEQVTFVTSSGTEYDVVRKSWGYYATPSLNGRLPNYRLRPVLVRNTFDKVYLLLVEQGHEADFEAYLAAEQQKIICWLDDDEIISKIINVLSDVAELRDL